MHLSKDEKNLGVALIDIGGGSTTIALFEQGEFVIYYCYSCRWRSYYKRYFDWTYERQRKKLKKLKLKHGHAFYDHASEDGVFQCSNYWQRSASTI